MMVRGKPPPGMPTAEDVATIVFLLALIVVVLAVCKM